MRPSSAQPPMPAREQNIVDALLIGLACPFGANLRPVTEVTADGRSRVDVAAVIDDTVIAIEVKRCDWRRAVGQAALNRYCADMSFIGLWSSHVTDRVVKEARQAGVGVLAIDHREVRVAEPSPVGNPDPQLRARLLGGLTP
jgi:hypothetical protein